MMIFGNSSPCWRERRHVAPLGLGFDGMGRAINMSRRWRWTGRSGWANAESSGGAPCL